MGHIETRFTIAAPSDRVFDLVVDTSRYPKWQTMTDELLARSGPADAVGASFVPASPPGTGSLAGTFTPGSS
jgi:hypothetical protein